MINNKNKFDPNAMSKGWEITLNFILFILLLLCLLPVLLVYIISFTGEESIMRNGYSFIPSDVTTKAYTFFFKWRKSDIQEFTGFNFYNYYRFCGWGHCYVHVCICNIPAGIQI